MERIFITIFLTVMIVLQSTVTGISSNISHQMEALTGPITPAFKADFSDLLSFIRENETDSFALYGENFNNLADGSMPESPIQIKKEDNYARVVEPDTKIAMAPTVVTEISSIEDFKKIVSGGLAATAIMNINKNLEVLANGTSEVIGSVSAMYEQMKSRVIPAFRVNDLDTVNNLINYLKYNGIEDAFVISKSPELVKKARDSYSIIRGVVEFDNVSSEATSSELMNIRNITNTNLSKIALIPCEAATRSNVQYLQQRMITVWTKETLSSAPDNRIITLHKMITSGSNGIVTIEPKKALEALAVYNHNITIIRKPLLIGHRGVLNLAPENTIEGSELAFLLGADNIENDIYPTKVGEDGKQYLVIMHDDTIDRTTTGSGFVYEKTLEELKTYFANKQFPKEYPNAKIPTLDQYLEKFKGKDQMIFVEIKSSDPATISLYTELIRKMGAAEHLVTISFNSDQLKSTAAQMPEMSLGWLCSGVANEADVYGSMRNALLQVQSLNSTFMPNYDGLGKGFMEASKHRGMTIWPWTFTDKDTIIKYFKMGIGSLTTNCSELFSNWAAEITPKESQVSLSDSKQASILANVKSYKGDVKEVTPDIIVLSGGDCISVNGNIVTPKRSGEAYVTLRYTANLSDGRDYTYDIYTQPIRIQVQKDDQAPSVPSELNLISKSSSAVKFNCTENNG
ncbi:MAG: glycerophosphodiester phosphodiesterase family protein [Bacillota bacterium]|nr:glycerophosphodiester phosphodiesterase family protein [Bacillota bacterium]